MPNGLETRTHCKNDHEFTVENTGWRSRKPGGAKTLRFCRICRRAAQAEARKKPEYKVKAQIYRDQTRDKQREWWRKSQAKKHASMTAEEIHAEYAARYARESGKDMAKKDPLQYLKLEPDAAKLSDEVNFQVDRVDEVDRSRPLCEGNPGPYMDYPEDLPPTVVDAMKLCFGCPILEQCAAYGAKLNEGTNQADGVWGGEVYKNGEKLYG